jgi:D-3-phosphoglycerate dehydrogenase / 2-oxoglutarate reductase
LPALSGRLKQYDSTVRPAQWQAMKDGAGITRPLCETSGLIGFGQIGRLAARKAAALGFRILVHDPHTAPEALPQKGPSRCPWTR